MLTDKMRINFRVLSFDPVKRIGIVVDKSNFHYRIDKNSFVDSEVLFIDDLISATTDGSQRVEDIAIERRAHLEELKERPNFDSAGGPEKDAVSWTPSGTPWQSPGIPDSGDSRKRAQVEAEMFGIQPARLDAKTFNEFTPKEIVLEILRAYKEVRDQK